MLVSRITKIGNGRVDEDGSCATDLHDLLDAESAVQDGADQRRTLGDSEWHRDGSC